jgi:hypothetical protein
MKKYLNSRTVFAFGFALLLALILSAQGTAPVQIGSDTVLVVNGKAVQAKVRQIDGRSYVDIGALAQATQHRKVAEIPAR